MYFEPFLLQADAVTYLGRGELPFLILNTDLSDVGALRA